MPLPPKKIPTQKQVELGLKLRDMRRAFAKHPATKDTPVEEDIPVEVLGDEAGVYGKTITDRWEAGHAVDFERFWAYIKVLKRKAADRRLLVKFKRALDELVQGMYPDLYDEFVSAKKAGDPRDQEEFAQDRHDSSRRREHGRPRALGRAREALQPLQRIVDPPMLPREDVQAPDSWQHLPNKAFEVNVIFPIETSTISIHRSGAGVSGTPYLLSIDLRDQEYAIYSEEGKKSLRDLFVGRQVKPALLKASTAIHEFLMTVEGERADLSWKDVIAPDFLPLRWASGGVLPIVNCLKRARRAGGWDDDGNWVALFLRDIPPVGLNVGNGASETVDEFRTLEKLIGREFAEELIVLDKAPTAGSPATQFVFLEQSGGRSLVDFASVNNFVEKHRVLREAHDRVCIELGASRFVTPMHTPFAVRVFDEPEQRSAAPIGAPVEQITRCRDVIFSLNPAELGIEIVRPYRFYLHEGEWLMDGEILPSSRAPYPYLVRRPIIMIKLEFLRGQFHQNGGGLGDIAEEAKYLGGKTLSEIPSDMFRLFVDLEPRRARLENIEELLMSDHVTTDHKESLEREHKLITGWLAEYGQLFQDAQNAQQNGKPLTAKELRTLCPVSYKTIELGLRHNIFGS